VEQLGPAPTVAFQDFRCQHRKTVISLCRDWEGRNAGRGFFASVVVVVHIPLPDLFLQLLDSRFQCRIAGTVTACSNQGPGSATYFPRFQ
jgi:hypothetical protein